MKILSINNSYNNKTKCISPNKQGNVFFINNSAGDIVSFSAKKYDSETILNPTNHCAYCGCQVYSEHQIDSIAKEILQAKSDRLQGKIKNILEKLEGAKNSEELVVAKRLENESEINFFKSFMDIASKKTYLKGEAIFQEVYGKNVNESLDILRTNLKPILRTVDHVSPQNEGKDNNNSDVNLVEACWCCNHDLKKGMPFLEFYTMYPSIKNNMPSDKFQYATSSLLDSQSDGVVQRLSAANLLKTIQRLFIQRNEAKSYLDSIDFRIQSSIDAINSAIETSGIELDEKKAELAQKEAQLAELQKDAEFKSILDRISISKGVETQKSIISQLNSKMQAISNQINELTNPPKKKSNKQLRDKKDSELTEDEKNLKIESLKGQIRHIKSQIEEHEAVRRDFEGQIKYLDEQFPTIAEMQYKKNQSDAVVNAHQQLPSKIKNLDEKRSELLGLQDAKKKLMTRLSEFPENFREPETFSEDIQSGYNRYLELIEALNFIEEHPNGGNINSLIKQSAKPVIMQELVDLKNNSLVIQYNMQQEHTSLKNELSVIEKNISAVESEISMLESEKLKLTETAAIMSQEEAASQFDYWTTRIRITTEKEQYLKLPQIIDSIKSEILLIQQTISDLQSKLSDIRMQIHKS